MFQLWDCLMLSAATPVPSSGPHFHVSEFTEWLIRDILFIVLGPLMDT